jgi:cell division protein ZapD
MTDDMIIYEQPINELIRACLRLEAAFSQLDYRLSEMGLSGSNAVLVNLVQILQLLDRPDLKAKLAKELSYHSAFLGRLRKTPDVDTAKLEQLQIKIDQLMKTFIDSSGKIAQKLRDVELLNHLRLQLTLPGGGCSFDMPLYHYWLQQPISVREQDIADWTNEFSPLREAIFIITQLLREATKHFSKVADHGFYQELLDPQLNLKLIRVFIPKSIPAYPEISVGRHFLSIRFFSPELYHRPQQYTENISFSLAYG